MNRKKKARLEAAGWKVATAAEFLGLTPEEEALVEARVALTRKVRQVREEQGLTQAQFLPPGPHWLRRLRHAV